MAKHPDYFVVMLDYGKSCEAIVDPEMTWAGALAEVREACATGRGVLFVHHITSELGLVDRTEEAFWKVSEHLADEGEPITWTQYFWLETHISATCAQAFRIEEAA